MIKVKLRLKELRDEKKLTQQQLADILKIRRNTYGRYETGERVVPIEILWALADYYRESIDYLVGRID